MFHYTELLTVIMLLIQWTARAIMLGYNCTDEKELEDALGLCWCISVDMSFTLATWSSFYLWRWNKRECGMYSSVFYHVSPSRMYLRIELTFEVDRWYVLISWGSCYVVVWFPKLSRCMPVIKIFYIMSFLFVWCDVGISVDACEILMRLDFEL